jgi:hypothetical protein
MESFGDDSDDESATVVAFADPAGSPPELSEHPARIARASNAPAIPHPFA